MKKTIMLILCILILIVGCDEQKESNERKENRVSASSMEEIYTVMCDGHKYVIYDGINKGGIVHAESCECKETTNDK